MSTSSLKHKRSNDYDINNNMKKSKVNNIDEIMIKEGIINLVNKRGIEKTCWPSEIPRLQLKLNNWREYLQLTRDVCFQLCKAGIIEISQKGSKLTNEQLSSCKGPIRIRKIDWFEWCFFINYFWKNWKNLMIIFWSTSWFIQHFSNEGDDGYK